MVKRCVPQEEEQARQYDLVSAVPEVL
jgi:hypothetical protein